MSQPRNPGTIPDLTGRALTVRGPVDPSALGPTLMHEHLFVDLRRPLWNRRPGEDEPAFHEPLTLANLAAVRQGRPNADNDVLGDFDEMLDEVNVFARLGGGTIVDVTNLSLGRDPEALRSLSAASGLHIVMGAGWYTPTFHPADMDELAVDDLTAQLVTDITIGVAGTGIRSGIIGEVGADTDPLTPNEWKSIRASARASRLTGAPVSFHAGGVGEEKFAVLDVMAEEGVGPENVVVGHADPMALDPAFGRRILERGVFIELDFLTSPGSPWGAIFLNSDFKIAAGIAALVADGFAGQILLGHDVCQKIQLARYGGHGFGYISRHFLPHLKELGVSADDLDRIMIENPARALAFATPAAAVSSVGI